MRRGASGRSRRAVPALAVALAGSLLLAGCSAGGDQPETVSSDRSASPVEPGELDRDGGDASQGSGAGDTAYAVPAPGPLKTPILTPDLLITSARTIPDEARARIAAVAGVFAVLPMGLASLSANGRTLTIAAADPDGFRRFTLFQAATADEVWERVAGGEIAVDPSLPKRLEERKGYLRLGNTDDAPLVHIGAYAPLVKQISGVVNPKRADQLGVPENNALLVSTGELTPSAITDKLKKVLPAGATMQTLALEFDGARDIAVLTGESVTSAVGTFSYTANGDGTINPQASWVEEYIRAETVPILGRVTCNKGMLPQMRAAFTEIQQRGLADKINPEEYAGCYYPRFIGRSAANGLSLHSWGIAFDLNVPGNQRGTVGEMDRQVVAIFKKWGFAWGGDWNYTDPMHFEMARVVKVD